MFAIFDTLDIFNTWHTTMKASLGYPLYGFNQATNDLDQSNAITEYTTAYTNNNDKRVIAWVGDLNQDLTIIDENDIKWQSWFPAKDALP